MVNTQIGNLAQAAAEWVGKVLADRWRLESVARVDLLATSYSATDVDGNACTVRLVHPALATVPIVTQSFVPVARMAAAIPHPDTVPFVDSGAVLGGAPFVVLGPAEGETVGELVARRPARVPPTEALRIVVDALSMLMAAHGEGLIHGGLRPEQVLVRASGAVCLTGFGLRPLYLAAMRHFGLSPWLELAAFTPPELARNPDARVTGSCDVWGASAVLLHLLTGDTAHGEETARDQLAALASRPSRVLRDWAPRAPLALERVVLRGLALSPRERFASARSMRAALTQAMSLPEVTMLRDLRSVGLGPPSSRDTRPSQHPTPTGGVLPATELLEAPPAAGQPIALPRTPAPSARGVEAVLVGPGGVGRPNSAIAARAITLPALPSVDLATDRNPRSSRDGLLTGCLGRAWAARSVAEEVVPWRQRIVEITQARLAGTPAPMTIDVLPWGLRVGETETWEADLGLLPIVHRLYTGGLRSVVIEQALDTTEAETLIELPFLLGEMGPGSDMRCALWSTRVGRLHLTLDDDVEMRGDQLKLAEERREVLALARFDTSLQLEECWQNAERHRPKEPAGAWREAHQGALGPLYSLGLSPDGLRDDFRARLVEQLEAESQMEPQRIEAFRAVAQSGRMLDVTPPAPTRPERHDARVSVIAALCRLVEIAGTSVDGDTVQGAVAALAGALAHAREVGEAVIDISLLDTVLEVSGEPLRAGRAAYAAADSMAQALVEMGASRLQFATDLEATSVARLYDACTNSVRGVVDRGLLATRIDGIGVESAARARGSARGRSSAVTGLEGYARALVALRGYYAGMSARAPAELRWVRRIAHRIVDMVLLSESSARAALALAHSHRDPAARALHGALLSVVSAKELGARRETLSRLALAALLKNVAEVMASSSAELPAGLAALLLAAGGSCSEALAGVVAGFGAACLDRGGAGAQQTEGFPSLLTSRLVHQAGKLVDSLSRTDVHRSPAESLRALLETDLGDPECCCLVVGSVGALPVGTVVELDNGAWGVVAEPGFDPERLDRPTVRLLTTNAGRAVARPSRADLSRGMVGGPQRAVRLVPARFARFNVVPALSLDG